MKKLLLLLTLITLVSCNNDDTPQPTHEFRDSLVSTYKLKSIYTDVAIDLNGDGVPQTNLMLEAECFNYISFQIYMAEFNYNEWGDYKTFWLNVPYSDYEHATETYNTCLQDAMVFYGYDIDEESKEISINDRDEEMEALYGTLTDVHWENNIAYFTLTHKLYTTQGWQNVTIYMEYLKWDFINNIPK